MQGARIGWGTALVLALAAAVASAVGETITPLRAKAKFGAARRSGALRHSLKLQFLVNPSLLLDLHDPAEHDLRVSLGGTTLVNAPAAAEGYRTRRGVWRFKGAAAGGTVIVKGDGLTGRFTLKLRRADLHDLRDGDGTDLPLLLDVGGTLIESTASFDVREGRVTRWAGFAGRGGAGGPPPGGSGPVAFSTLVEGLDTDLFPRRPRVARTQSEWDVLWAQHAEFHPALQPVVDFSQNMVIGVFIELPTKPNSPGRTNTARVVSIADGSAGRAVVWEEVVDGAVWTCPPPGVGAPCAQAMPYQFVLAPQSALPVTFTAQ